MRSPAGRRSVPALLVDSTFGPFFLGKVLSSCGIWIQNLAASVLMYELTGSPLMVGMVSVAQFGASTFLPVWSGALTDRLNRAALIILGRVISAVAVLFLAAMLMVSGTDGFGGPAVILIAVVVMGVGLGLSSPAMQAVVPSLVDPPSLEPALALSSSAPSVARAVGPVIGAWLVLAFDFGVAFLVSGVTHLLFAGLLMNLKLQSTERRGARPAVFGGIRYALAEPGVGRMIVAIAVIGIGADPVVTLTPPIADQLGGGAALVGYLAAGFGVGSILLTLALGGIRRWVPLGVVGVGGFVVLGSGMLVVAATTTVPLAVAGFFIAGVGYMMSSVALNTSIQQRVPDALRGRVMALFIIAFLGSRPIGAAMNGAIAELFSVRSALVALAVLMASSAWLARPVDRPTA